ncbi:MAG TPA: HIT family protein [Propionibacteriaceae bacterium]
MTPEAASGRAERDIFCQIASGDLPAAVVTRTHDLVAFLDHRPVFKGHVLIAPVRHVDTLLDLPTPLMTPLLTLAARVAAALSHGLGAQGTFVAMNNVVSQSVPHLHLHVVPRTKGDGLRGFFWPRTSYGAGEMDSYAARIRDALDG